MSEYEIATFETPHSWSRRIDGDRITDSCEHCDVVRDIEPDKDGHGIVVKYR